MQRRHFTVCLQLEGYQLFLCWLGRPGGEGKFGDAGGRGEMAASVSLGSREGPDPDHERRGWAL